MVRQSLRFGDCTLDVAARELRRGGVRVELAPTVFDCIAYLVEHRDRAVGRDELVSAVWGKASISDTMLGKAVLAARRAIGDDAQAQAFLRTVPRFGYHWVADVEIVDVPIDRNAAVEPGHPRFTPDAEPGHPRSGHPRSGPDVAAQIMGVQNPDAHRQNVDVPVRNVSVPAVRRGIAYAAVALVLIALVAAGAWWLARVDSGRPLVVDARTAPPDSSAVLPAEIAAEPDDAWLRLGFMDLIATRLRGAGVPVVASDSIVRLAPQGTTPEAALAAVRRAVDVQHVVQPALRRSGTRWIARAELVDADGTRRAAQAEADSPIAAANDAADRVLALFGRRADTPAAVPPTLTELVQRIDAARLSDRMDEAQSLLEHAPAALKNEPELRMRQIQFDLRGGELATARDHVRALLADVPAETDPVMHGRALESLCVVESRSGDMPAALRACDGAIALLESRDQPVALGRAYNHRGIIHVRELRRDAALADFSRSRVVLGAAGDPLLIAMVDGNESVVQMDFGRPADALPGLVRAGRQFQRFGMFSEFVVSLVNETQAQLALLQPLEALQATDLAWSERHRISDPVLRLQYTVARAEALQANGRLGEARGLLDEVLHGAEGKPDSAEAALARADLAQLDLDAGHDASAVLLAQQAIPALAATEFSSPRASAALTLTRALRRLDRGGEASTQTNALAAWAKGSMRPEVGVIAAVAQAEQAAAEHRAADASAAYEQSLQLAGAQGRGDMQVLVAESYAGFLIGSGTLDRAAVVAGQVARHAERDYASALLQWRLYRALGRDDAAAVSLARVRRLAGERPVPKGEAGTDLVRAAEASPGR